MKRVVQVCLAVILILSLPRVAIAQQVITVPKGNHVVMIDGKISPGEWDDAGRFSLGGLAHVYVKQSEGYLWMAVECLTCEMFALDFYVQPADGLLYDLHSSAKIGERKFQSGSWPEPWTWWNNDRWVANWSRVDSFENREFLPQKVREYQISRQRFTGDTWRVMFELQLPAKPEWRTSRFPQEAKNMSTEHWITFDFR